MDTFPATRSVRRKHHRCENEGFLLAMGLTIWGEKKTFHSFGVPLDLTKLTYVGLENEDFVSQDNISITFQASYFPVKDIQFSKPLAGVSQSFLIVLFLRCHRNIISHSENGV